MCWSTCFPGLQGHGSGTPFKALVVKVEEVFKKTPARFRSKPAPLPPSQPLCMTEAKVRSFQAAAGDGAGGACLRGPLTGGLGCQAGTNRNRLF